jgi:hypothetical protein
MRPAPGNASYSEAALPPIRLLGYRRFVGLRSLFAVSSVASGRIEFVSGGLYWTPHLYGLTVHFQLLSTSPRGDAVTFRYWREAPPQRDLHPLGHVHSQAHERLALRAVAPRSAAQPIDRRLQLFDRATRAAR